MKVDCILSKLSPAWQHPDIVFCIERSSDDDWVIVYKVRRTKKGGPIDWENPMDVFWLDLAQGDSPEARQELSKMERWAGYGIEVGRTSIAHNSFKFHLKGFPGRNIEVQAKESGSAALCTLGKTRCILRRIHLQLKTGFFKNPAKPVQHVDLVGEREGKLYYEKFSD